MKPLTAIIGFFAIVGFATVMGIVIAFLTIWIEDRRIMRERREKH